MAVATRKSHVHAVAFDRGSARSIDAQGFLHVDGCNISKATVNPYYGAEIPDYEQLGLDPNKIYMLFRDPKELEKAAATFNDLPLMDNHVEVSAEDLEDPKVHGKVVGTTGSNARFEDPYLVNELVVWTAGGIEGVMSKAQTQLSCAYRYELDMTPGEYQGQKYDGRMFNLAGNHVALVDEGRAGPDVVVKDRKLKKPAVDMKAVAKMMSDALAPVKKTIGMAYDCIPDLVAALTKVKAIIESKLKPGVEGADAKVLDDCTSAIDLAVHHLLDYAEDEEAVALDENPEGINQYGTGPSANKTASAGKASAKAIKSGKSEAHSEAEKAHSEAAKTASSPAIKGWHEAMSKGHGAAAGGKSVKFGRNFGDMPQISGGDDNPEGINQYTGAASHADRVGKAAGAKGGPSHKDAQAAHQKAAVAANRAGDASKTSQHLRVASAHGALHSDPSNAMAKGVLAGHYGTRAKDDNPEGINQYTGGHSSKAAEASKNANNATEATKERVFGQPKSRQHQRAANAHATAANAHREARAAAKASGNKEAENFHDKSYFQHREASNHHQQLSNRLSERGDAKLATDKIEHREGHKDSKGKPAPWVIVSESTGRVIWSGPSKEAAAAQLRNVEGHKAGAKDSVIADVEEREDINPKAGKEKYGEVKFADPKNKKYPIDTPEHVRAALSYWGQAKNRNMYKKEDQTTIANNIKKAAKRFKIGEFAESN